MRSLIVVSLLCSCASLMWSDQVTLKNGDRLSGSISKSDGKTLVIKTDYAGEVTVKFDAIQDISTTSDLHVEMGGKTAVGAVSTSGDNVVVATKTAGPVEAPRSAITVVRSAAEQAAYEKDAASGVE